ncbi:hypothetical protein AKO1_008161 [Acrasis kona]|uniref:Uncharacterized protein n=1 Tax=Acrasis kona TaxID=1008807 RepID=A0AAW2YMZ6_9EUKA
MTIINQVELVKRDRTTFKVNDYVMFSTDLNSFGGITNIELWNIGGKSIPIAFIDKFFVHNCVSDDLCPRVNTLRVVDQTHAHINDLVPILIAEKNQEQRVCIFY